MSEANKDNTATDNSGDPQQPSADEAQQESQQDPQQDSQQDSQPAPSEQDLESWSAGSDVKTKSWYSIPNAAWALAVVALLIVGAAGFYAGSRSASFNGTSTVNMAGASAGKGEIAPVPGPNEEFDASIYGPKAGAQLKSPEDMDNVHRRNENDPFALGAVDAPVVISIYSDFECPFCAKFANETEPDLVEKYVNEGLVRLEWNDMAINGEKAIKDAEAGRAAAAQGKFWEFSRALFKKAGEKGQGHPEFTEKELIAVAREAGVPDMKRFEKELKDGKWTEAVENATQFGSMLGISGTPGFLVGTQFVSGAQPRDVFEDNIELALIHAKRMEEAGK